MANKRVKSDRPIQPISDWQQADKFVKQIGELQFKTRDAERQANNDINQAKAALAIATNPLQEEIEQLRLSLEAFAVNRKADFGKDRSRKLNFGLLGWRKSSSVAIKKTTLEKIKSVFAKAKAAMCIITKETVSKEALAKLTDEELASVGARREVKDDFFVEPDLPEAVDYTD
ncbi:MAG: host-nuclease inhibitor Gam family protein [Sedimentisphaerales bacterium]|nr:host-nuclease inhibitor Gam family protein [Sedimentisphaerales bacterium]